MPLSHTFAEIKNIPSSQKYVHLTSMPLSKVYAITSIALSQKYIQLQ